MILANKKALKTRTKVQLLHIRDRELDYFYENCNQLANMAALLSGFCFSGLTYLRYVDRDICERTGCAMLALWQSTLASMLAPGLALRGPPGSMDIAVNRLVEEYQASMRLFGTSLFLFMVTAVLWSWTFNSWKMSAIGTVTMAVVMRTIYGAVRRVFYDFDFNPNLSNANAFDFRNAETGRWSERDGFPMLSADPVPPASPMHKRFFGRAAFLSATPHTVERECSGRSTAESAASSDLSVTSRGILKSSRQSAQAAAAAANPATTTVRSTATLL